MELHTRKLRSLLALLTTLLMPANAFSTPAVGIKPSDLFSAHTRKFSFPAKKNDVVLTYLEINGWLLSTCGITILIDPLLEGPLDFGIPDLYQGKKRVIPSSGVAETLPPIDCILLTQGLDDHAHVRTLQKLQKLDPTVPIVAPLSAEGALRTSGFWKGGKAGIFRSQQSTPQVRFLKHQQTTIISPRKVEKEDGSTVTIRATTGALVGPPWQRRENGYILQGSSSSSKDGPSIYIEPHVEFNARELRKLGPVDIVISPISGQTLPAFELVHGCEETMRLMEILQPKFLVPMQNGDIDTEGPVAKFVSEVGSMQEFERRLSSSSLATKLVDVYPGKDIQIPL